MKRRLSLIACGLGLACMMLPPNAALGDDKKVCGEKVVKNGLITRRRLLAAGVGLYAAAMVNYVVQETKKDRSDIDEQRLLRKYGEWIKKYERRQEEVRQPMANDDPFRAFMRGYAGKTPFEACLLQTKPSLGPIAYAAAVENHRVVDMVPAFRGKAFLNLDDPRNVKISQNISNLVKNNPPDNLLIVWAGALHIFQYYLDTKDTRSVYAAYPVNEASKYGTPFMEDLKSVGYQPAVGILGESSPTFFQLAALEAVYQYRQRGELPLHEVLNPELPLSTSNVILIADFHHIQDQGLAPSLPDAAYWKKRGIKSVTLAMEGLENGKTYDRETVYSATKIPPQSKEKIDAIRRQFDEYAKLLEQIKSLPPEKQKALMEKPEIQKALHEMEVFQKAYERPAPWHVPELFDLLQRLDEYTPQELPVTYVGIDV